MFFWDQRSFLVVYILYVLDWYGIPSGTMVTAPVRFEFPGQWQIVPDVVLTETESSKLEHIVKVYTRRCHVFASACMMCYYRKMSQMLSLILRSGEAKKIMGLRGLMVKPAPGYCWGTNPRKRSNRFMNNYKA